MPTGSCNTHTTDASAAIMPASNQLLNGAGIDTALANEHLQRILTIGANAACALTQHLHQPSYLQPDIIRAEFDTLLGLAMDGAHELV
jgi:hypothetical protein